MGYGVGEMNEKEKEENCPMCQTKLIPISEKMAPGMFEACGGCGREWYWLGENLASKPRKVKIVAPLIEGAKLDDCIKPIEARKK
jgi:uncharacterized protein with PIN domain